VWGPPMYYYLGTANKGLPAPWFYGAVLLRDLAVIGVGVLIVRSVLHPELDPVRLRPGRPGRPVAGADPDGGVLDGAPDAGWFTAWRRRATGGPPLVGARTTTRSGRD